MYTRKNNYAFIDSQNVYRGIKSLGWSLDWERFRVYLREKYDVSEAYLFIGFIQKHSDLYAELQRSGYILIFKPVLETKKGQIKGNVDADMVLQTMIEFPNYDKALVITSDGDFYSLVRYLKEQGKLEMVLSPYKATCSILLRQTARDSMNYIDDLKDKVGERLTN